jgi:hypothetical protein
VYRNLADTHSGRRGAEAIETDEDDGEDVGGEADAEEEGEPAVTEAEDGEAAADIAANVAPVPAEGAGLAGRTEADVAAAAPKNVASAVCLCADFSQLDRLLIHVHVQ